jgi:hypothetical protein
VSTIWFGVGGVERGRRLRPACGVRIAEIRNRIAHRRIDHAHLRQGPRQGRPKRTIGAYGRARRVAQIGRGALGRSNGCAPARVCRRAGHQDHGYRHPTHGEVDPTSRAPVTSRRHMLFICDHPHDCAALRTRVKERPAECRMLALYISAPTLSSHTTRSAASHVPLP